MTPLENLLAKLPGAKKAGKGWSARCPAHDDQRASLSIAQGDDGTALIMCHAGCDTSTILAAVGMKLAELFPAKTGPMPTRNRKQTTAGRTFPTAKEAIAELERKHGKRSTPWTYHDAKGEPVGVVVRWDKPSGKNIRPVAHLADGWRIGAMPEPRPLYGLPELAAANRIIITEGEKAADAARSLGFVATTSAGGSQAATKTEWRPLAGKEIWILPDNDPPGRKYADIVANILAKLTPAPVVRVVELPNLPEHGDIADWINAHGDAAEPDAMRVEIEALGQAVEPWRPGDADDLAYRHFPIQAMPEVLGRYVTEAAAALGCDPAMVALPVLATCAGAIGYSRVVSPKRDWREPLVTWTVVIAESGTLKSPAHDLGVQPIRDIQADIFATHKREVMACNEANGHGEECEEPAEPRIIQVSDTTIEKLIGTLDDNPRGVLLEMDELHAWFNSFTRYKTGKGGIDAPQWLSIHRAGPVRYDRKTGDKRRVYVAYAAVSVCGTIQPAILSGAVHGDLLDSGMAAQLLFAMPPEKNKQLSEVEVSPDTEARYTALIKRLLELCPVRRNGIGLPHILTLGPEAKAIWIKHYNEWATVQYGAEGALKAAFAKLEGGALRLAGIHHVCTHLGRMDGDDLAPINAESMTAGITLAKWFAHEAERVLAMLGETPDERDQRRLVEWIGRKGGTVTPREVQQGCRWLKEPGVAETALEELVKACCGTWRSVPTSTKGGRPAWAFVLSTPSTVYETPAKPEARGSFADVDSVDAPESGTPASGGQSDLFGNTTPAGPYRDGF
jgi:hypothetical protein